MSLKSPGLLLTGLVLKVSIFAKKSLKDTGKNTTRIEKKNEKKRQSKHSRANSKNEKTRKKKNDLNKKHVKYFKRTKAHRKNR